MTPKSNYVVVSLASVLVGVIGTLAFSSLIRYGDDSLQPEQGPPLTLLTENRPGLSGSEYSEITDPRVSFRQLAGIAQRLALADPEEAARRAKEIPGHDNREHYLGEVLRTWGEKDGKGAATWALGYFKGEQLTDALYYISDGWAEADPEGAAEWFGENSEGTVLDDAMWEILESWGRKRPAEALAWTSNLDDYVKSTAMQGLAEGWGAVDPEGAVEAGMTMGKTGYGFDFLVSVTTQWAGSDPVKAAQWAEGIVHEKLRAAVLSELGEVWSHTDPGSAAKWAAGLKDPGSRHFAENGIAIGWSEHDPSGAVEWALNSIKDEEQLNEVVGDITFTWTNLDPRGAVKWLKAQPPGPKSDTVLTIFSSEILDDDPKAATMWAAQIHDPTLRDSHLRKILDGWVSFSGDAARAEIQELDIPDSIKKEFAKETN